MDGTIRAVISVCDIKDIRTWVTASKNIKKFITAEAYLVVVPGDYAAVFEALSESGWTVVAEGTLAPEFSRETVAAALSEATRSRAGWYYQQLLKIKALIAFGVGEEKLLIWDADTIPLRPLTFFHDNNAIFFSSDEHHAPYFEATKRLMGMEKMVAFSFIAQNLPCYSNWIAEFVSFIEGRHQKPWHQAILDCIDVDQACGFSEYETLGTFFVSRFQSRMAVNSDRWERMGDQVVRLADVPNLPITDRLPAYVAFESWAQRPVEAKAVIHRPSDEGGFLNAFFNQLFTPRTLVQVGANDGVMCDPVRRYLTDPQHNGVFAVLIEPVDDYYQALKRLYADRSNTLVLKAAASSTEAVRPFFYIDPRVASTMNGDGPKNDWAHGQGSFFKESVVYWINENRFRGENYRSNIEYYKQSIIETAVNCTPLRNVSMGRRPVVLLMIDAQGAELDVLLGCDWENPPEFIYYENDRETKSIIDKLLAGMGYDYLCGQHDKIYYNRTTIITMNDAPAETAGGA